MKKFIPVLIAAPCLFLSGCLFPEKFSAKVDVNQDASYRVHFSGTAAHAMAVMQMVSSKRPLNAKEEAQMEQEAKTYAKVKWVINAKYIGNGRFQLAIDEVHAVGSSTNMFDVLKVSTDKQGVMTIASPSITEGDKKELGKLGLKIDGVLDVSIPKNAEVISTNATSSPKFFGLFGTYSWKIGDINTRPMMKLRFKN